MITFDRNKPGRIADFIAAQSDGSAINLLRKTFDGQFMKGIRTAAGSMIARCSFKDGGIYGSNFKRTTFVKCDFSGTQIYGTIFTKCDFNDCIFDNVEFSSTEFDKGCVFNNCTFNGTDISDIKKVSGIPEQPDKIIGEDFGEAPTTESFRRSVEEFFASEDFLSKFENTGDGVWKFTGAGNDRIRLEICLPPFEDNSFVMPIGRLVFTFGVDDTTPEGNRFYSKMIEGENNVEFPIDFADANGLVDGFSVAKENIKNTFNRELAYQLQKIYDKMEYYKNVSGGRTEIEADNEGTMKKIVECFKQ